MADPKSMSNEELLNLIKKTTSPSSKTASHSKSLSHTLGNDVLDKTDVSSDINPKEDGNVLKEDSPVGELSENVERFTPDIESLTTVNSDLQPSDQHNAKLQGENMEFENCDKCKGEGVVKKTMNAVVKSSDSVEIDEELVTLLSKEEITNLLHEYRTELETNKQKLVQCERQLNKANDYNDVLRNMVEKLSGEIHRYRHMKTCDKDVQVDNDDFNNYINGVVTMPIWQDDTPYIQIDTTQIIENNALDEITTGSLSIADSIKQTAECVVQQQQYNQLTDLGYMYDEQSGLYYHSASGYYYDQTKSLFYDPNTGIYYYYDYDSGQYVFHSQIELQHSNNEVKLNTQDENTGRKTPAGKNTPRKKEISKSSRKRSGRDKDFKNRRERRLTLIDEKRKSRRKSSSDLKKSIKDQKSRHRKKRRRENGDNSDHSECDTPSRSRSHDKMAVHFSKDGKNRSKRRDTIKNKEKKFRESVNDNDADIITIDKDSNETNDDTICVISDSNEVEVDLVSDDTVNISTDDDMEASDTDTLKVQTDDDDDEIETDQKDGSVDNRKTSSDSKETKKKKSSHKHKSRHKRKKPHKKHKKNKKRRHRSSSKSDTESGELSDSDVGALSEHSGDNDDDGDDDNDDDGDDNDVSDAVEEVMSTRETEEVANSWAPCIRVIVTDSDCIDMGTFYMITCTGGKIGRENCDINIPDINISKSHAVISYKTETRHYEIIDLASQNGTFINQHRLSPSKIASEPYTINHGDNIQIGSTILLCHIHHGTDTCDQCEPGVVQASLKSQQSQQEYKVLSKEERLRLKKQELFQIKKKYGLKNSSYEDNKEIFNNPNYVDKAEERRKTVGSEHPSIKKHETPASVHRPISSGNIGHKLLQKMGWKEGESLGKNNSGLQEPISVTLRANQTAGLGSSDAGNFSQDDVNTSDMKKASRRIQAQQRYQQIDTGKLSTSDKASNKQWKQGGTEYT